MSTERIVAAEQRVEAASVAPRVRSAVQHILPLVKIIDVKGVAGDDVCTIRFRSKNTRLDPNFMVAIAKAVRNIGRLRTLEATLSLDGRAEAATYILDVTRVKPREE